MSDEDDIESLPSASVRFLVISEKATALEWHALRLRASVTVSKEGIAHALLIAMDARNVSQVEFVPLLDDFADALVEVIEELGGVEGVREHLVAEVRLSIFANDSINASVFLPRKLIDTVSRYGLDFYFSA